MKRYSKQPFPPYRFVPGESPHPRRDPKGHSYGTAEPKPPRVPPEEWAKNEPYLFGIDLYNSGFWWECHEQLEALWHLTGHKGVESQHLQGIIQIAAANLQRHVGHEDGATRLANEGLRRLADVPDRFMGVDVPEFAADARGYLLERNKSQPALIKLAQ
jgi:hypothetical protein